MSGNGLNTDYIESMVALYDLRTASSRAVLDWKAPQSSGLDLTSVCFAHSYEYTKNVVSNAATLVACGDAAFAFDIRKLGSGPFSGAQLHGTAIRCGGISGPNGNAGSTCSVAVTDTTGLYSVDLQSTGFNSTSKSAKAADDSAVTTNVAPAHVTETARLKEIDPEEKGEVFKVPTDFLYYDMCIGGGGSSVFVCDAMDAVWQFRSC